jgi:hypothetical protein
MNKIELTIHKVGNGSFRFFIPSIPSKEIFKKRKQKVILIIDNKEFPTHTTCGPIDWSNLKKNQKKGYDLYSSKISKWIIDNELYIKDSNGKCRKVEFVFSYRDKVIILTKN